jgi:hypothetical protein
VTPLLLHVGRVVEGVLTRGTARFIGHVFRRSRRANERPAPARALQGGDVGPFVQVDQLHFHARLSLTSPVPRRRCAEVARPNILGAPAGGRRMGTCRGPRCGDHRPDKSVSPGRRAGWSRTGLRPKECSEGNTLGVRKQGALQLKDKERNGEEQRRSAATSPSGQLVGLSDVPQKQNCGGMRRDAATSRGPASAPGQLRAGRPGHGRRRDANRAEVTGPGGA